MVVRRFDAGYSRALAEPFGRVLSLGSLPVQCDPRRIPIGVAHALLDQAVRVSHDPAIGLKAGAQLSLGDGGALDYAMNSAATVADAFATASRFIRVLNGELDIHVQRAASRALLRFSSHTITPPVVEDFLLCAIYTVHVRRYLPEGAELECWLTQPRPATCTAHAAAFAGARLSFAAPHSGFAFDASALGAALDTADPKLHAILVRQLERELNELPESRSFTERVRKLLLQQTPLRDSTLPTIAAALQLGERTLARRLAGEGTSVGALLDEARRSRAAELLTEPSVSVDEIAATLGFSSDSAFHRAWKRWTGMTPRQYVKSRRGPPAGP